MSSLQLSNALPVSSVFADALLAITVRGNSMGGEPLYATTVANAIAELIKFLIALGFACADKSLTETIRSLSLERLFKFAIPNLMMAINSNIFQHGIAYLPPAIFLLTIIAMRLMCQIGISRVSGHTLSKNQIGAFVLALLCWIMMALPDIIDICFTGRFFGTRLSILLGSSFAIGCFSLIASSTLSNMSRENNRICTGIVNYSFGMLFQLFGILYAAVMTNKHLILQSFTVKVSWIAFLIAISGLLFAHFIREFHGSIVYICSCIVALLVHSVLYYLDDSISNAHFAIGWVFMVSATVVFMTDKTNHDASMDLYGFISKVEVFVRAKYSMNTIVAMAASILVTLTLLMYWISDSPVLSSSPTSSSGMSTSYASGPLFDNVESCPIFEVPITDPRSNLKRVYSMGSRYGTQFSHIDDETGELTVKCPGSLYVLGQEIGFNPAEDSQWRVLDLSHPKFIRRESGVVPIAWSDVLRADDEYAWLYCDVYRDVNFVFRPANPENAVKRKPLSSIEKRRIRDLIASKSVPIITSDASDSSSKSATSVPTGEPQPIFDSILIVYFDSVSRIKFHHFFEKTMDLFADHMADIHGDDKSSHVAIPLMRLHSLGTNSAPNYLPMMAGIDPRIATMYKPKDNSRELWLFDMAEEMKYETLSGYSGCHFRCRNNCSQALKTHKGYEPGGYLMQYLMDTQNRQPGKFSWPSGSQCEGFARDELQGRKGSTCSPVKSEQRLWLGNKLAYSYVFDWYKSYIASHAHRNDESTGDFVRRFGVLVMEETHRNTVITTWDDELEELFKDLFFHDRSSKYRTGNTAMLLLADHGMHFHNEYIFGSGKIANKQPMGFMILPKTYLQTHPHDARNLYHNAKILMSHLDLRATVQYWMTGREWSAIAEGQKPDGSYASNFGVNLHTTALSPDRTCEQAGIPSSFCGCNRYECTRDIRPLVSEYFEEIVAFVNQKIVDVSPESLNICKPLTAKELKLTPGSADCVMNSEGTIDINVAVDQTENVLAATLQRQPDGKLKVVNVITASLIVWDHCVKEFAAKKQSHTIPPSHWQFCYCGRKHTWYTYFMDVASSI